MTKIRINKEKMINHATTLGDSAGKLDYYPLKNENMSYTQTNSIHLLRESLLELLEASMHKMLLLESSKGGSFCKTR
ncbi:DUF3130 family protein [Listeria monocytogenes]|uniref:DUF3130 family protein n=1 Tax=Listeria monocytogenes TaxID=1639 RepID=UPI0002593C32|nr:DUF3130 family protein [Listeria monocytogenes]AFH79684.1 hypothetical protein MUO_05780 [Listeria monocytogenes 07PF0776]